MHSRPEQVCGGCGPCGLGVVLGKCTPGLNFPLRQVAAQHPKTVCTLMLTAPACSLAAALPAGCLHRPAAASAAQAQRADLAHGARHSQVGGCTQRCTQHACAVHILPVTPSHPNGGGTVLSSVRARFACNPLHPNGMAVASCFLQCVHLLGGDGQAARFLP